MDPLSVTASVIAVLQAANYVVSVCYDFRAAIKEKPWALTRITSSVNELRLILSRLEELANESELEFDNARTARLSTFGALCKDGGALTSCHEELKELQRKLDGGWVGKETSKRKALIQSIGWQLKAKDAEDLLKRLEGYKSTLNLAITLDQSALIKSMSQTIKDVDETTKSMFHQFRDISLDNRNRDMLQWLSPVDPSISQDAALKVHQSGTNDWFLSSKEFKKWQEAENSHLWLSGFPGSGKTVLMSTVIDHLQRQKEVPILAYFYCDFRTPETRDPLNLAGSLLAQICFQLNFFPAALGDIFDRCKMSSSPFGNQANLTTTAEMLLEVASEHPVVILVDALDECEKRNDILDFFKKLCEVGSALSNMNILISSRDEVEIRESLGSFPRISMESAAQNVDSDINRYINHRLESDSGFKWLKPSFKQTIRERLTGQANGMFRWVQCQLDQIVRLKTMRDIREALNHLPEGLQETYENILGKIDVHNTRIVTEILQWLVCSVSPLNLDELHECLAIEYGMDHIDEEAQLSSPRDIYDLCSSLIMVTAEGDVILAHLSVKDYLLSERIKKGKASAFALSEVDANAENALKCLTYLSFAEFRSGPAKTARDFGARLTEHPFLDHASRWWATYAENAGFDSREMTQRVLRERVLQFFTAPYRPQFESWLQVLCTQVVLTPQDLRRSTIQRRMRLYNEYPKQASWLYYAASFGIKHVVQALLEQGAEVDHEGGRLGGTALHAAALRGHIKVMDVLYERGADPNKVDFIDKTPLHSAALVGNVEVIRWLLDHGANPAARDDSGETAHEVACRWHSDEAAKILADFK